MHISPADELVQGRPVDRGDPLGVALQDLERDALLSIRDGDQLVQGASNHAVEVLDVPERYQGRIRVEPS